MESVKLMPGSVPITTVARRRTNWRSAYTMMFPTIVLLLAFMYYPAIMAIVYSFTNWDGLNQPSFVGILNYAQVLRDPVFWLSMQHLLLWALFRLIVDLMIPLVVASMIYHLTSRRAQYLYRVLFVIPMVIPNVVALMVWSFIYDPNVGVLNGTLKAIGLSGLALDWLGNPKLALGALMFVGFPFVIPFNLLIFYAGLQNISDSVYEAARLDGAGVWRRFFQLEMPLVLGQLKLLMILTVIGLLQNVMLPLVLTNGGPGYATYMPGLYMYFAAFQNGQIAVGLAVAMIIFIIVLGLTLVQVRFIRPSTEFEA